MLKSSPSVREVRGRTRSMNVSASGKALFPRSRASRTTSRRSMISGEMVNFETLGRASRQTRLNSGK